MSKAPSMPMYWDAYLADTTHLTTEEHGAYLLLLAAMWRRNGTVPDDDRDNARILGLTVGKWRKVKARIEGFLIFKDGQISQKNLQKIWENTQEKIEKNRLNGSKGGRPKSKENNDIGKPDGFVSDNPKETIPEPEPESLKRDTKVSPKSESTAMPEGWIPDQAKAESLIEKYNLIPEELNLVFKRMKDECDAKNIRYKNWDLAFANWVGKSVEWGNIGPGSKFRHNATQSSGSAFD